MRNVYIGVACVAALALAVVSTSSRPADDIIPADPLAAVAGTAAAEAIPLTTAQLTETASLIVIGRATGVESRWIDPRNLGTFATIAVDDVLKGSAGSTITVVTPGGSDANRRIPVAMSYPGAPRISQAERVLLFLAADSDFSDSHSIVGYAQGKFSIVRDPSGRDVVARENVALRLQSGPGVTYSTVQMVPLADVTAAIRALVQ
jgi:hypothetical protein